MSKFISAVTKADVIYPGFVNLTEQDDGTVILSVRGDPTTREGIYICGYSTDRGKPGRCTPGDDHCNNYCNMAPNKGPMADSPAPCTQVKCGETVAVRLTIKDLEQIGFAPAALNKRTERGEG